MYDTVLELTYYVTTNYDFVAKIVTLDCSSNFTS